MGPRTCRWQIGTTSYWFLSILTNIIWPAYQLGRFIVFRWTAMVIMTHSWHILVIVSELYDRTLRENSVHELFGSGCYLRVSSIALLGDGLHVQAHASLN